MCSFQNPDNRISILQMNSELEHAQLELLGAHCAVHQLRLHYSSDDLARFGRRDVLRKSAEAATALRDFYAAIESKIPHAGPSFSVPQPSAEQIGQAIDWLAGYLREQREHHSAVATPLTKEGKARLWPFFSADLLDRIRIIELRGARVRVPDFFAKVRALGFEPPEITHMDSVTFLDIIAFNQHVSERALFRYGTRAGSSSFPEAPCWPMPKKASSSSFKEWNWLQDRARMTEKASRTSSCSS